MSDPYVGEIRMFGGNFAPREWAFCNGQTMGVSQYQVLFALIGTTFGGNGTTTFQLPDLQGRLPVGQGQGNGLTNRIVGQSSGQENVTVATANLPAHNHQLNASTVAANAVAIGTTVLPGKTTDHFYTIPGTPAPTTGNLNANTVGNTTGGNQAHPNLMPSLCVSFIMSLTGYFPSRN